MSFLLFGSITQFLVKMLLILVALFLIMLILVQRGRGGGLAGAFGGMGGTSAFGAKAGDVFTKITIIAASVWIVLCLVAANLTPQSDNELDTGGGIDVGSAAATNDGPALDSSALEETDSTDEDSTDESEPEADSSDDAVEAEEPAADVADES